LSALLVIGLTFGFKTTRAIERIAVSINLAAIPAFLAALAWFNGDALLSGEWEAPPAIDSLDLGGIRQVLGMLLVVQG
jgi:hypothetical protein